MNAENVGRSIDQLLRDATQSVLREKLLEHVFLAEFLP